MSWLTSFLLPHVLPYLLQALAVPLVTLVGKVIEKLELHLPRSALLVVAATVGELMAQLPALLGDIPGLPPGTGAALTVFIREVYDQSKKTISGTAKRIG